MVTCKNGHAVPDDDKFCPECGVRIAHGVKDPRRWRRILAGVLALLTVCGVVLSTAGGWTRRTIVDTDRYVSIVGPLIEDPAVQQALADRITTTLFENLHVEATVQENLPPEAAFLAAPMTSAAEGFVNDQVVKVLQTDAAHKIWIDVNEFGHQTIIAVLENKGDLVQVNNGTVTLNLLPIIDQALQFIQTKASGLLGRQVTLPTAEELQQMVPAEAEKQLEYRLGVTLPDNFGQITLFSSEELGQAQRALAALEMTVFALAGLTLLLLIASLGFSVSRRRTLAQIAAGSFFGLLIVRRLALRLQDDIVAKAPKGTNKDAIAAVVKAFMDNLRGFTTPIFVITGLIAVVAFLAGKPEWFRALAARGRTVGDWARDLAGSKGPETTTARWIRVHSDALKIGGAVVAAVLLFMVSLSWASFFVIVALLALWIGGLTYVQRGAEV